MPRSEPAIRVVREREGTTLVIEGEIDVDAVGHLDTVLSKLEAERIRLDLGSVTFLDSRGLELLIRHRVALRDAGRSLEIVRRSQAVDRMLAMTGAQRFFREGGRRSTV